MFYYLSDYFLASANSLLLFFHFRNLLYNAMYEFKLHDIYWGLLITAHAWRVLFLNIVESMTTFSDDLRKTKLLTELNSS